eukprot:2998549-Lingulodinium_polyedra.AAC.1
MARPEARRAAAHAAAVAAASAARAAGAAARAAGDLAASATLLSAVGAADAAAACLLPDPQLLETEARVAAVRPVIEAHVQAAHQDSPVAVAPHAKVRRNLAVHEAFGDGG